MQGRGRPNHCKRHGKPVKEIRLHLLTRDFRKALAANANGFTKWRCIKRE